MASLYEINAAILACMDEETGEVFEPERLSRLMLAREEKIEGVALWLKNVESEIAALDAERKSFETRICDARKLREDLKAWLDTALSGADFRTARCLISFRASQRVEVTDAQALPSEYLRVKSSTEPDLPAIRAALKSGAEIDGCRMVRCRNIQIK